MEHAEIQAPTESHTEHPLNSTLIYNMRDHDQEFIYRFHSRSSSQAVLQGNIILRTIRAEDGITIYTPED